MTEFSLELKNIRKSFTAEETVLDNISLSVKRGEFITLLGASGCGKTTTLRIIAGLEQPDEGSVYLDGKEVTHLDPNQRNVNTVFQNYALFPHMNVAENIGYGLKLRKVPKAQIRQKVEEMLELVQPSGYEKRKPSELSGGQRQRVAIARALANSPKVLLLDEPLGALDLQLRRAMQMELKHLQKKLGITFIYITHDQEEAINMSDRIAVMNHGKMEQMGTPDEIYNHPKTSYVASFVGNANILHGTVEKTEGNMALIRLGENLIQINTVYDTDKACVTGTREEKNTDRELGTGIEGKEAKTQKQTIQKQMPQKQTAQTQVTPGETVRFAVRSENIRIEEENCSVLAVVKEKSFAGGQLRLTFELSDGTQVTASRYGIDAQIKEGQQVQIGFAPSDAVLVDREEIHEEA